MARDTLEVCWPIRGCINAEILSDKLLSVEAVKSARIFVYFWTMALAQALRLRRGAPVSQALRCFSTPPAEVIIMFYNIYLFHLFILRFCFQT